MTFALVSQFYLVGAFSVIVKPSHNLRLKLCRPLVPNKTNLPVSLQRGGQPPRDLAGLVEELVLAEAGQEPAWGAQFRSFLKQRSVVVTTSVMSLQLDYQMIPIVDICNHSLHLLFFCTILFTLNNIQGHPDQRPGESGGRAGLRDPGFEAEYAAGPGQVRT